jgi:CubicO group peptidase (beta-lactamase class C family)
MKRLLVLTLILTVSFTSFSQPLDRRKLDSLFNILAAQNLAVGSIAITQNGKLIYQRTFGKDQTAATTYRVGSITKVFTAVMIYQLIDGKKLSLDETLDKFFPDLPNAAQITIADMLGHRSGLPNFTAPATNFDSWKDQPQTQEQLLAYIRNQQPDFAPGTKADYNNSNFLLLGYILEKLEHKPYKEIVKERIVDKLNLPDTYYGDHAGFQGKETASYKYFDNQWRQEKAVFLGNFGGAGAMISTPRDLCKFIKALFDGKLVSRASLARMTHIEKDGYGWGLFPFGDKLHKGYGHNGKTEGFASSVQYYPENGLAIGYCTCGELYPKDDILEDVVDICFREPCTIPTFRSIRLSDRQLGKFVGTYEGGNDLRVSSSAVSGWLQLKLKGQQFVLEPYSDHEFRNVRFGFFFDFEKDGRQLVIHDAASTYSLHKL